ncbi:hypothetical protein EJ05DRAFT_490915 [Pseudovirgaria hyperparasitica]|uniref:Uncharacterized protein n=1 Tax=Pseudovirgaria hyperparasitica TaxID=470096 RepID=A0A6A6VRJ3_9PEZI|nr:uncharacterized protein EJ05DRAFT_490915 [Pseudovirgaria hyperparasitica]KAF2752406.1 hypothetical protein EJ05DRAFT_490915 [Pseudovirgaria hyperparasitica]
MNMQYVQDTLAPQTAASRSLPMGASIWLLLKVASFHPRASSNQPPPPLSDDLGDCNKSLFDNHSGLGSSQVTADDIPASLLEFNDLVFGDQASFEADPGIPTQGLTNSLRFLSSAPLAKGLGKGRRLRQSRSTCLRIITILCVPPLESTTSSLLCNNRTEPNDVPMTGQSDHVNCLMIKAPMRPTSQLRPAPKASRKRTKRSSRSKELYCKLCGSSFFATRTIYKIHLRSAEHTERISELGLAATEDHGHLSVKQIPNTTEHSQEEVRYASPSMHLSDILSPGCDLRLHECRIHILGFMTVDWDQTTNQWTGKAADNRPYLESKAYNERGGTGEDLREYGVDPALAKEQVKVLFEPGCEDTDAFVQTLVLETDCGLVSFVYCDDSNTWSLSRNVCKLKVSWQEVAQVMFMAVS